MKATPLISLGISVMLGIGAVLVGRGYMMSKETSADAQASVAAVQMTSVWVAASTINMGDTVDGTVLTATDWPTSALPVGVLTDITALGEGKFARGMIVAGEPISLMKLDETRSMMTLASAIQPGMRAVSITVRKDTGVAGFVLPGDRVDVNEFIKKISSDNITSDVAVSGEYLAQPVLKNVHVLAVDQMFNPGMEGAHPSNTVTLEVSSGDALKLGVASQRGTLGLALIGREEDIQVEVAERIVPVVRRAPVRRARVVAKPKKMTVTVINGSKLTEVTTPVSKQNKKEEAQ